MMMITSITILTRAAPSSPGKVRCPDKVRCPHKVCCPGKVCGSTVVLDCTTLNELNHACMRRIQPNIDSSNIVQNCFACRMRHPKHLCQPKADTRPSVYMYRILSFY